MIFDQALGQVASLAEGLSASNVSLDQLEHDRVERYDFYTYFREANRRMQNRQRELWEPKLTKDLRHELYYEGYQVLVPRPNSFGFDIRQIKEKHRVYVVNRLRSYSDEQTGMWMSINPKIAPLVLSEDHASIQREIDAYQALRDHFNWSWFTPDFLQKCAKHAQFCGGYHAEVWFDKDSRRGQEYVKQYKQVNLPAQKLGYCLNCEAVGNYPPDGVTPACASCGSPYVETHDIAGVDGLQVPDGEGWQPAGEVEAIFDPSWARRYSLTVGPELSPWCYHERDEVRETVEAQYGKLNGSNPEEWAADEILHPGRIIRRAERARGVYNRFESDDECVMAQRFFYEPEMLHFVALDKPTTLPSGEQIPPNVRLSEVYPRGMCIKTSPGLPHFLDVYRESHKQRFIQGYYSISPGRPQPAGNEEAPDYNKYLNVLLSGAFNHALNTLQPSMAIVEEIFPDGRLFNREDRTIKVNIAQLKALEGGLDKAFRPVVPPPINPAVGNLMDFFTGDLRRATKSETYLNSEDAGVKPNTATASRIGEDRNARSNSPQLANFADFQRRLIERGCEIAKENYGDLRLISVSDEDKHQRVSQVLKKADLKSAVRWYVEQNSWLPDLQIEKRAAYKEGLEAYLAAQQAGLGGPQILKSINRTFGIDLAADRQLERIVSCEETLQKITEALPTVQTAIELYALAPVDPAELGHETKMLWWREWKSSPQARKAPALLREAADLFIQAHAAAFMDDRAFIAVAAQIGQGLIAPPIQAGLQPGEQQAPAPVQIPQQAGGEQFSADALQKPVI